MEIVNIEAGTFKEMVTSIQMLKEKLENLKGRQTSKSLDDWMDNQEVCQQLRISSRTLQTLRDHEKQRYLTLLPDRPKDLLSETGCYQTD